MHNGNKYPLGSIPNSSFGKYLYDAVGGVSEKDLLAPYIGKSEEVIENLLSNKNTSVQIQEDANQEFTDHLEEATELGMGVRSGMLKSGKKGSGNKKSPNKVKEVEAKISDASGGNILRRGATNNGDPRIVIQKGDRTFDITANRVKEFIKNPKNPKAQYGDQIDFRKKGVPEGSERVIGTGKGHKRTPTKAELDLLNGTD